MDNAGLSDLTPMSALHGASGGLSEEEKCAERKRDITVLVLRFLADYGFTNTYQSLCAESSLNLGQVASYPVATSSSLQASMVLVSSAVAELSTKTTQWVCLLQA